MATLFPHLPLVQLKAIKQWHIDHRHHNPLEYHLWDTMLMLWVLGRIGWLPALALEAEWTLPLCLVCMVAPELYVLWRRRAHLAQRLRCDWLHLRTQPYSGH
ncbi:MAG: hypothetical protein ACT4NV_16385 [Rhodoferax sp.]